MDKKGTEQIELSKTHRIRVTLSSRESKALHLVVERIMEASKAREIQGVKLNRLPQKTLRIPVRKAPNGNGTNTFDRFQMRIYSANIDCMTTADSVRHITNVDIEPGVIINVTILQE